MADGATTKYEWKTRNFRYSGSGDLLMHQLAEFLNITYVKNFKIVYVDKTYMEIIYYG